MTRPIEDPMIAPVRREESLSVEFVSEGWREI